MKTTNIEKYDQLPQRQKKFAKTKIALLGALIKELEKKTFQDIMIKEIAKIAEVSEPTFFNYFDSKQDMLVYFIQIWSIEMNAIAKESQKNSTSYLETIKSIFSKTSTKIMTNPQIVLEIISFQAQMKLEDIRFHEITNGERWYLFKEILDVEELEAKGLESILPPLIEKAVKNGELKENTDVELLFLMLSSLFFGTSLLILKKDPNQLLTMLDKEIDIVFQTFKQ